MFCYGFQGEVLYQSVKQTINYTQKELKMKQWEGQNTVGVSACPLLAHQRLNCLAVVTVARSPAHRIEIQLMVTRTPVQRSLWEQDSASKFINRFLKYTKGRSSLKESSFVLGTQNLTSINKVQCHFSSKVRKLSTLLTIQLQCNLRPFNNFVKPTFIRIFVLKFPSSVLTYFLKQPMLLV